MKSLFIILTVISSLFANNSFATDDINPAVIKSFHRTFKDATEANWSVSEDRYKVQFYLAAQQITAYYDKQGTLLFVVRNISSFQLPLLLQAEIKNKYVNYWISNLYEESGVNGTDYYVTLENSDTKVVLKSYSHAGWSVQQKESK
ncbi:hypothetical protein OCK74_21240 [Chitinophagaceae bacterium LB-8]|jgi:hypothetical protein|uniref:Beta-lactamase-inhibitor-like PepSY-like domain-containing protein n=1 Tax=Paraflavisolibacter caeni TaxID=2982496 RepID=A0A9X2XY07_9BACT|nr:hypothetical protein [Paraflavisolibacter caeni]MCU7551659.1 hypothetical protein [Paraflavisolibacter caeni]